jgi:hypothetical protein
VRGCGAWQSHWNCGVRFGTQCHIQPQTQRAVRCRTQLAIELASQAGARCATRRAIHCRTERGIEVLTDGGPEFPDLGAIDGRAEPGTQRATEQRAKSLDDGHIDGQVEGRVDCRAVPGVEPRGHPRIDPPVASASLRHSPGLSGRARSWSTGFRRGFRIRRQISI